MTNDGLNSRPALTALALFVLLVAIVAFKRRRGQDVCVSPTVLGPR